MRRTVIAVTTLAAALACGACGSSGGSGGSTAVRSSVAASSAAPSAAESPGQQCGSLAWPQKLPDFRGKPLGDTVVGAALCYDITSITAADGTDVMHDAKAMTKPWTVTAQTPAPGTSVTAQTPIVLKVSAAQ